MRHHHGEADGEFCRFAPVAQRTEQLPSKQEVVGSNPARGAERTNRTERGFAGSARLFMEQPAGCAVTERRRR